MFEAIRYWIGTIGHPDARALGFAAGGLGIERRYRKLAAHWEPHFAHCRALNSWWMRAQSPRLGASPSLAILGAGRLFDVDVALFANHFSQIHLVDADPTAASTWRQIKHRIGNQVSVTSHLCDLTGCLKLWTDYLLSVDLPGSGPAARDRLLSEVARLPETVSTPRNDELNPIFAADAILSTNLLSQLLVFLQHNVEAVLTKRLGRAAAATQDDWVLSLRRPGKALIANHLARLTRLGAQTVLLITDLEYCNYSGTLRFSPSQFQPPPALWNAKQDEWVVTDKSVTTLERIDALYGFDLEGWFEREAPAWQRRLHPPWLWHIAPQGVESRDRGTIHRVAAWEFWRASTP
ncbi:MAG: hypothetical protein KDD44_07040 [Bdellovibrionales bacterium]|nr:hypothetical protein [Bdellovibrionales bacterium]